MQTNHFNNSKQPRGRKSANAVLLGNPTPAKAAGFTFSLAVVLPLVLAIVFAVVLAFVGGTSEEHKNADWYLYANFLLSQLSFALAALCCFFYAKKPIKHAAKALQCRPKYIFLGITMQIGLLCLSELNALFLRLVGKFGYVSPTILLPSMDGFGVVGVLFVVGVLPAIFEEILFRGIVLGGLKSFRPVYAVLLCGGLFALFHQNPAQTLYQFCCGVAFALVAWKSGSILPTVLAHFLNNAMILLLQKFGITAFPAPVFLIIMITSIACVAGTLIYLFVFDKNDKKVKNDEAGNEDSKQERKRFFLASAVGVVVCALTWLLVLFSGT